MERQIYRNGDSDYLIDGKKVRLRDIHDLFMDTGLGRDSFSIISQGRVEAIFNSKPEERRAIFEEAAGVLKYKTRKKETESKLNQTQGNLDRLEDIIHELDNQLTPLIKQAEVAKKFLTLDEKRKESYLDVLVAQIKAGKADLTNQEEKVKEVKADLTTYYAHREQMETENQTLKKQRHNIQAESERLQEEVVSLTQMISDLEGKIALYDLEANQKAASKAEAQGRLETLERRQKEVEEELLGKASAQEEMQGDLTVVQAKIVDLTAEIANYSENPDKVIEGLRDSYVKLMQDEVAKSNQVTALEGQIDTLTQASESQAAEVAKLNQDLVLAKEEARKGQEALEEAQNSVRDLLTDYQKASNKYQVLEKDYQDQRENMFALMDDVKAKTARRQSLENILKNHTHFYAGVRSVLQEAGKLGGILGAVSDHLNFNPTYQTALEVALGAASQHIIVEDEKAATRAIAFLKKNRQGRATFLPLTTIKPRQLSAHHLTNLQEQRGFLGVAVDLVSFPSDVSPIFQNLLGLTAVFETLEQANQAARQTRFQVRLVTLDGSEIRPGGSYAGGANRNNNSSFIKPELDSLIKEVTELEEQLQKVEKKVANQKDQLLDQQERLSELKEKGEQARLAEQKSALYYQTLASRLSDLTALASGQADTDALIDIKDLEKQLMTLKASLTQLDQDKKALNQQINQVKDNKDAIESHLKGLNQALSDAKLRENQLSSEYGFSQTEKERLETEARRLKEEISGLEGLMSDKMSQISPKDKEQYESQLEKGKSRKDSLTQKQIRLKFELEDLEAQSEDLAERMAQARTKNDDLIRRQTKLEATIEHLSEALHHLLANLAEHFQLSFEAAEAQSKPIEHLSEAEQSLKQLESHIRRLGPVNLEAIAQFEEVSQRLDFLNSQKEDLLSAKNLLLETIQGMDNEVKERFQETFEAIRVSFQQTFKQMFGGGSADLILTETDLLTAGIEISAQPPGKKIQSLNLMSGGEKALSALALLFAIIRVKTIPFVILDEVEAALDEANVKRFGDYLNRFDKSSQFIVVTHRKGTMAAADAMYGVTMQESGVSKIVSVKLKDLEREEK